MDKIVTELQNVLVAMQHNLWFAFKLVALLWIIHFINRALQYRLNYLGIYPRSTQGLVGIIFAPLLHGSFNHLFFNSIPLLILFDLALLDGRTTFYFSSATIIILSGFLIWLFGRRALHIGASSLIMGYFGYLIAGAYFHFTVKTIILAVVCLYYFGGLLLALFPSANKDVSWEGHVFGFMAGIITAFFVPIILVVL